MKLPKTFPRRIFLLALILRLIPVLMSINLQIGLDDMFQYDMLARSLVAGNGYRWYAEEDVELILPYLDIDVTTVDYEPIGILSSHRAPLYPAFLAVIYFLVGMKWRFLGVRIVQAFIGALLAPLTYALARRVFPEEERVGKIAAGAMAVYPMLVAFPIALATENIFFVLVLGALVALLRAGESQKTRDYVIAGVLMGLAALTRSVIVGFLPLAMFWAWRWGKSTRGAVILPVCVLLFTVPWAVRNTLLHDQLTFVETGMGYNMYLGYHPEGTGSFQFGISLDLLTILDDAERHRVGMETAMGFIRDDPGRVPYLMVYKLGRFFGLERRAMTYFYANNFFGYFPFPLLLAVFLIFLLPFVVITSLAAVGLPFQRWRKEFILLVFLAVTYLGPHLLILAEPRFHLTLMPILSVLAAHTWVRRAEVWAQMRMPNARLRTALAVILVAALLYNVGLELYKDADKLAILFGPEGNRAWFSY